MYNDGSLQCYSNRVLLQLLLLYVLTQSALQYLALYSTIDTRAIIFLTLYVVTVYHIVLSYNTAGFISAVDGVNDSHCHCAHHYNYILSKYLCHYLLVRQVEPGRGGASFLADRRSPQLAPAPPTPALAWGKWMLSYLSAPPTPITVIKMLFNPLSLAGP